MLVPIIMGSKRDLGHVEPICAELGVLGIPYETRVASAHKATRYLLELLRQYEADARSKVYITVAGLSNALSAMVDANVVGPVIAVPPYSPSFGGADVFSSLRLPSGVAPAVVLDPRSAALLAAKMLSLTVPDLRARIVERHERASSDVERADEELRSR